MDFFRSNGAEKLSVNTDFSDHYVKAVDSLWQNSHSIYASGDIAIRGDTFDFYGQKDVLIFSVKGFKSVYLFPMETCNNPDESSIEERRAFEIDYMKQVNEEQPSLYISGRVSKETGYPEGLRDILTTYNDDLKVAFFRTMFQRDQEQQKFPSRSSDNSTIVVQFYLSPDLNLFVDYLISKGLMPSEDSKVFVGLESDAYPEMLPYIRQFQIQHDYLLQTAKENDFTLQNSYDYNDCDYSVFVSARGNLAIQDQNTYYEFVKTFVGIDVYAYDINSVDPKTLVIDPDNKYSCIFSVSNNDIRKVDSVHLYCLIIDMSGAVSSLKEDGYSEIKYPEDVTSIDYLVKYYMQNGQSKEDALINIFLFGRYDAENKKMSECEARYLTYRECRDPEYLQGYSGVRTPLFRLSQLNDTLEDIGELTPEWTDALRQIEVALKDNKNFGAYDNSNHHMDPSAYRRVMNMFQLDTDEKCQEFRNTLLQSLDSHINSQNTCKP